MIYGYCRISTPKQNMDRQIRNILSAFPEARIVQEIFTGTKFQGRKELDKILRTIQPGDSIVFDSVSRMSRNADEGYTLYEHLFKEGVNLIFLKEAHINTDTYKKAIDSHLQISFNSGDKDMDQLMAGIIEALNKYILCLARRQIQLAFEQSEKEVLDLKQRTREGIETARRNGQQIGHKKGATLITQKSLDAKPIILKHSKNFGGNLKNDEVAKLAGISLRSLKKYKNDLISEISISSIDEVREKYKMN